MVPVSRTLRRIPETGLQILPVEVWLSRRIFRSCTSVRRIGIATTRVRCPAIGICERLTLSAGLVTATRGCGRPVTGVLFGPVAAADRYPASTGSPKQPGV